MLKNDERDKPLREKIFVPFASLKSQRAKTIIDEDQLLIKNKYRNTKEDITLDKFWMYPMFFMKLWKKNASEVSGSISLSELNFYVQFTTQTTLYNIEQCFKGNVLSIVFYF